MYVKNNGLKINLNFFVEGGIYNKTLVYFRHRNNAMTHTH